MIIVNLDSTCVRSKSIYQYDYGAVLRLQGAKLPTAVEIQFSFEERGGQSKSRIGITKDGVTDVVIPDLFVENNFTSQDYKIYVFIYLTDENSGRTEYKITIPVKSRPQLEAFDKPEDAELFREAIAEVNKSATSAQESATKAETAKEESVAAAKEANQSAQEANTSAKSSKTSANESKEAADTANSAANASISAKNTAVSAAGSAEENALAASRSAHEAKQSAEQADTAAKSANESKQTIEQLKTEIGSTAEQIATDRTAVEADKKEVQKAKSDVENLKDAIEQKSSEAITEIGTAKDNAIKDVNTAKDTAVSAVTQEKEFAVSAVYDAEDAVVEEINRNENVQQIQKNKDDIADIKETVYEKVQNTDLMQEYTNGNIYIVPKGTCYVGGKNFLDFQDGTSESNGITCTVNNGEITLNGTATSNTRFWFQQSIVLDTSLKYISQIFANKYIYPSIGVLYAKDQYGTYAIENKINAGTKTTVSTPINSDLNYFGIYIPSGTMVDNLMIKPMLNIGESESVYQYGIQPVICDIERDIRVTDYCCVQGKCVVTYYKEKTNKQNTNILIGTEQGSTINVADSFESQLLGLNVYGNSTQTQTQGYNLWKGGELKAKSGASGTGYMQLDSSVVDLFKELPNGTYYVSYTPLGTGSMGTNVGKIVFNDANRVALITADSKFEMTDELRDQIAAVALYGYYPSIENIVKDFMINIISANQQYEPYSGGYASPCLEYPQEIKNPDSTEINVNNKGYVEKGMSFTNIRKVALKKGYWVFVKNNQSANCMSAFVSDDPDLLEKINPVNSGGLYSYCIANGMNNSINSGSTISGDARLTAGWKNGLMYYVNANDLYLYYANNTATLDSADCWVWFGESKDGLSVIPNVPYLEQSLTLLNTLAAVPVPSGGNYTDSDGNHWVCDEVDFERGVYVQRIAKYTFSGDENITNSAVYPADSGKYVEETVRYQLTQSNNKSGTEYRVYCSHLKSGKYATNVACCYDGYIFIFVPSSKFPTTDTFKEFLKQQNENGHPVEVMYVLGTPKEFEVSDEVIKAYKNLHTYNPDTVLKNDNELQMKLDYQRDINIIIKNLEDAIASITN